MIDNDEDGNTDNETKNNDSDQAERDWCRGSPLNEQEERKEHHNLQRTHTQGLRHFLPVQLGLREKFKI